jgi:hypothetical protein
MERGAERLPTVSSYELSAHSFAVDRAWRRRGLAFGAALIEQRTSGGSSRKLFTLGYLRN